MAWSGSVSINWQGLFWIPDQIGLSTDVAMNLASGLTPLGRRGYPRASALDTSITESHFGANSSSTDGTILKADMALNPVATAYLVQHAFQSSSWRAQWGIDRDT
jgi:hypothetical protein